MKNVLIVNQSAELYGADKALLQLIECYPPGYNPIVVLHHDGPLTIRLQQLGIKVINASVIKVKRGVLTPLFFLKLPFEIFKSIRSINAQLDGIKIDIVHSNAISVFIGAFYALFCRKKHLWHVHEIIEHPAAIAKAYPKIVAALADFIVFNSNASFNQFAKYKKGLERKSVIVHNGQTRSQPIASASEISAIRKDLFGVQNHATTIIGLVGRISRLKGQKLLLKAFRALRQQYQNIHLVYVGSAPDGQEHFLHNLTGKIREYDLEQHVSIVDFQENIWPVYDALDIVVVPSTEPESFGLVATEGMLSKKPVVGSNHGGLSEIIVDDLTGFLFENKNHSDLRSKLEILIGDKQKAARYGLNGYDRVRSEFSETRYVEGIKACYDRLA